MHDQHLVTKLIINVHEIIFLWKLRELNNFQNHACENKIKLHEIDDKEVRTNLEVGPERKNLIKKFSEILF